MFLYDIHKYSLLKKTVDKWNNLSDLHTTKYTVDWKKRGSTFVIITLEKHIRFL